MNNCTIGGRSVILNKQGDSNKFDKKANIIVRNLSKEVTQNEVFEMFKQFG